MPLLHDEKQDLTGGHFSTDKRSPSALDGQSRDEADALLARVADEFFVRLSAGERPDIDEYAQRHPEISDLIRRALPVLQLLDDSSSDSKEVRHDALPLQQPLGDYRLIREVGRGGMGIVYEAEQLSLQRRAALKMLPFAAVFDPRHVQRFKNEALAAAQLDHPHIVNVYGVGCERNVHFYAMRFIDGETLADVIRQLDSVKEPSEGRAKSGKAFNSSSVTVLPRAPDTRPTGSSGPRASTVPLAALRTEGAPRTREFFHAAARLTRDVAYALDYAHQRGIVHRDIKPSNLMLDTEGKVWVTDFGLARIDTDVSLTLSGDLLGTLRYMSPEQVLAKRVTVDHRTDVYSLGATLYELLTLQAAFPQTDRQELIRHITFDEPLRPRQLQSDIPIELETIVLKALEKNAAERYETADELAHDLQRYLDDVPIRARRSSVRKRISKWTIRHAGLVWSSIVVMVLLTLVLGGSTSWVLSAYQRERQLTAESRAVVAFLTDDLLAKADPDHEPDRDVKLRTVLDRAARDIEIRFPKSPLVRATILRTLGKTYHSLGEFSQAELHVQAALDLRQQHLGDEHPDTLRARHNLGELRFEEGDLEEAERIFRDVLEARIRTLGENHPETLESLHAIGRVSLRFGQLGEAGRLFTQVGKTRERELGETHPATLAVRMDIADYLTGRRDFQGARKHLAETLGKLEQTYGPLHPQTLRARLDIAGIDLSRGETEEAITALEAVVEICRQSLGITHPRTLIARNFLAAGYLAGNRLNDAERLCRRTLEQSGERFGEDHDITNTARSILGDVANVRGDDAEAEICYLHVLECELRTHGSLRLRCLAALQGLCGIYERLGRTWEAEQAREIVRSFERPWNDSGSLKFVGPVRLWDRDTYSADLAAAWAGQQAKLSGGLQFVDRFISTGTSGMKQPGSSAYEPDGELPVTSGGSGDGLQRPRGLTFGPDADLYVVCGETGSIHRYDGTSGAFLDVLVPAGRGGLTDPWDLALHDGHLYVSSQGTDSILQYDADSGAFECVLIGPGEGGLSRPRGIMLGGDNDLYVVCGGEVDAVLRYEVTTGRFLSVHITTQGEGYTLHDPWDVTAGEGGQMFVSSVGPSGNAVVRFDGSGRYVEHTFSEAVRSEGGAIALATHPSGQLFMTNLESNLLRSIPYDEEPEKRQRRVTSIRLPPESAGPTALVFDDDSNLYVSCHRSHEILRYGPGPYAVFKGRLATCRTRLHDSGQDSP